MSCVELSPKTVVKSAKSAENFVLFYHFLMISAKPHCRMQPLMLESVERKIL